MKTFLPSEEKTNEFYVVLVEELEELDAHEQPNRLHILTFGITTE